MLKKHKLFRVVAVVLFVCLLVSFVVHQVYVTAYEPVKTQTAFAADVYKTADTQIYAVRREMLLPTAASGYVVSMVNNFDKVASGQPIAASFANEECAQAYTSFRETQEEISYYEKLSKSTVSQYTDLDKLIRESDNAVLDFASAVYGGDLDKAHTCALAVRSGITMRQSASGEKTDYTGILSSLNNRSASYLAAAGQYASVLSPAAGYYTAEVDGYENLVDFDSVAKMSVDDIDRALRLSPKETQQRSTGKLITDFDWFFVCNIDITHMSEIRLGQVKKILLPYGSADDFFAEVYKINDTKDGKTAVVFRVNQVNAQLAQLRTAYVSIVLDSYSGYKIPNTAIRVLDGVKGVYILRNNLVTFKKADIFYSTDTYSIVGNAESKEGYIRLYDEVITEGTDLYDGKLIN